jgi:hypothetical protein
MAVACRTAGLRRVWPLHCGAESKLYLGPWSVIRLGYVPRHATLVGRASMVFRVASRILRTHWVLTLGVKWRTSSSESILTSTSMMIYALLLATSASSLTSHARLPDKQLLLPLAMYPIPFATSLTRTTLSLIISIITLRSISKIPY